MVYCNEKRTDLDKIFQVVKNEVGVVNDHLTVNITIVDEKEIHLLNKEYRNVDRATDVLSFPLLEGDFSNEANVLDVDMFTGELCLGDIYICDTICKGQAKEYGHSEMREFVYLLVHGLLHLFGYDHMEESDKKVMREKEEKIMEILGITRDE